MNKLKLNADWTALMDSYRNDHQNKKNQLCHAIGIPMIAASFPVGMTVVGLPLAAGMFTVGWGFQFVGHYFEGKPPSFVSDKRSLIVGLLWWAKKVGLDVVEETRADVEASDSFASPVSTLEASAAE